MGGARTTRVAASLSVAGCLVFVCAAAYAQPSPSPGDGSRPDVVPVLLGISEAEMRDLKFVAEQTGASIDDVITRYAWNDDFASVVGELQRAYPADFAAAEIVDASHAWVSFEGEVPPDLFSRADRFFPALGVHVATS